MELPIGSNEPMASRPASFRALVTASDWISLLAPRLGISAAGHAGALCHAVGLYGPRPDELHGVFPWLSAAETVRVAREQTRRDLRQKAFDRVLMSGGAERLLPYVRADGARWLQDMRDRRQAAVLLDVHVGPIGATGLALQCLHMTALLIRFSARGSQLPGFEVASLQGPEEQRAAALRRGLAWLKEGGFVAMAADGLLGGVTDPVPCCGRLVSFRRGAFSLARMAGVPIVPLFFTWSADGGSIQATACDPICAAGEEGPAEQERSMVRQVAAWLEGRLRAHPEALSVAALRWLQAGTPVTTAGR